MKTLFTLIIFVLVFVQDASAQQKKSNVIVVNASPNGEREITPFNTTIPASNDEKICGPYFVMFGENPRIMYKYAGATKELGTLGAMLRWKFVVKIDESKKMPTVEMVTTDGITIDQRTKVVVRISQSDYNKTEGCLPKPSAL